MRIVYLYQYFSTPKGSWGTRVYEFARRWVASGDRVTVITSVYDKSDLEPARFISTHTVDGIDVIVVNIRLSNKHGLLARLLSFAGYAVVASWYAATMPADVVIASSGPITVGLPGLVARYLRGRRVVFEARDVWPDGAIETGMLRSPLLIRAARLFERLCYRAASRIVTLSDGMAEVIRRRCGETPVEVVTNAADLELFREEREMGETFHALRQRPYVVYAGTLGLANACGQILEAARLLADRAGGPIEVVILGDGVERLWLQARARELGLTNVHFLGLVTKEEVGTWLRGARASLLVFRNVPILSTNSPNKFFDSLAAGCPVIQNTSGWIKRLLERHDCGITVPADDPRSLAAAMERLCSDDELRRELGRNARALAEEQFERSALANRMRDIVLGVAR